MTGVMGVDGGGAPAGRRGRQHGRTYVLRARTDVRADWARAVGRSTTQAGQRRAAASWQRPLASTAKSTAPAPARHQELTQLHRPARTLY